MVHSAPIKVAPIAYLQHTGEPAHTVQVLLLMSLVVVLTLALLRNQKLQHWRKRTLEPWLGPQPWHASTRSSGGSRAGAVR